jgi:hypothetical protein
MGDQGQSYNLIDTRFGGFSNMSLSNIKCSNGREYGGYFGRSVVGVRFRALRRSFGQRSSGCTDRREPFGDAYGHE